MLTYEHLLERVWAGKGSGGLNPMRNIVNKLRAKLGDDANTPTYIFTESRVGYWVPAGEGAGERQESRTEGMFLETET